MKFSYINLLFHICTKFSSLYVIVVKRLTHWVRFSNVTNCICWCWFTCWILIIKKEICYIFRWIVLWIKNWISSLISRNIRMVKWTSWLIFLPTSEPPLKSLWIEWKATQAGVVLLPMILMYNLFSWILQICIPNC